LPQHNQLLTAARTRIESPGSPGQPMTRHELAAAVNDHVYRATGRTGAVDAQHVGRWERGVNRWPAERYRTALRAVLNVATDAELGFHRPGQTNLDDVDRKTFLKTTLGAGAGILLAPSEANLIEILAGPTAHYRQMESAVPSDRLSPAVDAHLTLAANIVRDRLRTSDGFRVLSEIAGLAAWLAADRGDHATARRRYAEAISYAERTHHPLLISYMTASLGHFAVEAGDTNHGLTMLRRASAQLDINASDTARAWLASLLAVAHAAMGDRTRTIAALRRAEKLTSRQRGQPQWPWVFTFSAAKAAKYQASALGRLGDLRAARAAYTAASPALTAAKPRALAQVEHGPRTRPQRRPHHSLRPRRRSPDNRTHLRQRTNHPPRPPIPRKPTHQNRRSPPTRRRNGRPVRTGRRVTTVAITGHRGLPPATAILVNTALHIEISKRTSTDLIGISCIADGADTLFAKAVLDYGGTLHVIVPAKHYRESLPTDHHPTYDQLINQANKVTRLDHLTSDPKAHMNASLYMLTEADELIAVWDGKPARGHGGTADVVNAAEERGIPVTIVWPPGAKRD